MPFNPTHLLNGIAFAHGMNESEKSQGGNPTMQNMMKPEDEEALKKLHATLLNHHLNMMKAHHGEMARHASAVHVLTGGQPQGGTQ